MPDRGPLSAASWLSVGAALALLSCRAPPTTTPPDPAPPAVAPALEQPAAPASPRAVEGFAAVDLFGAKPLSIDDLFTRHGDIIEAMGRAFAAREREAYQRAKAALVAGVHELGDYAYVDVSLIEYFEPSPGTYVTIDVVRAEHRDRRMTFARAPTGSVADPDGLLAAWAQYEQSGFRLLRDGAIRQPPRCPALHCVFGFEHPELAAYADTFDEGARRHAESLARVLVEDADPNKRAAAAFVLAHTDDAARVVSLLVAAFRDPAPIVRNNAMRVVAMIASDRADIDVPIAPVVEALGYPSTTDRNKASAILVALSKRAEHHRTIALVAGEVLLEMLALWQPNNHEHAHEVLVNISGHDYGARDYAAWARWLAQVRG